jgi:hypothetical protein
MADLPPSLAYYGSYQGAMQILKHQSLPLFQAEQIPDPFLPNAHSRLDFDCQALFECSVKYMTSAILGKSAPRGNPNHPLQKAIRRWRGENRFNDEAEIRDSLVGLLPAMVEKQFNLAKEIFDEWLVFVETKRMLPLFENANNSELWLLEAARYSGVVIKFKVAEESIFEQCEPIKYNRLPPKPVSINNCVDLMMGELNEMPKDFMSLLLTQNYQFRTQKEWRLVVDRQPGDELVIDFPTELIQSIYLGASVPKLKSEQMCEVAKNLNSNMNVFQAVCAENNYDFQYEKR